ncbi:MAG: hypothetical protein ABGX27_04075 [Desulfurobacteriaceae bacterium]
MKKLLALLTAVVISGSVIEAKAEDWGLERVKEPFSSITKKIKVNENTKYKYAVGVNPLGLAFGIANVDVEFYRYTLGEGVYPTVGGEFYAYSSGGWDVVGLGVHVGIKKYFNEEGKPEGFYVRGFGAISYLGADYNYAGISGSSSVIALSIGGNAGYKWLFGKEKRFFVAPEIGLQIIINGSIEIDGEKLNEFSGLVPSGGFSVGYIF